MVRIRLILTLCCIFISIAALQAQPLYVGEMSSGGLGMTDIGNKYVMKGIALDFYRRLGSYYGSLEKWVFEPKVAEKIFKDYIAEENIELWCNRRGRSAICTDEEINFPVSGLTKLIILRL